MRASPRDRSCLTLGDTEQRRRYLNARATLGKLLELRAVPVVNENDTVATAEIRYGDNDRLAARVATMAGADCLILLSDVDGLYEAPPQERPDAKLIAIVERVTRHDRGDGRLAGLRICARRHAHQGRGGAHRDRSRSAYGDRQRTPCQPAEAHRRGKALAPGS